MLNPRLGCLLAVALLPGCGGCPTTPPTADAGAVVDAGSSSSLDAGLGAFTKERLVDAFDDDADCNRRLLPALRDIIEPGSNFEFFDEGEAVDDWFGPGISIDASLLAACTLAVEAATSACGLIDDDGACEDAFEGTQVDGTPCTSRHQCAGGLCRYDDSTGCSDCAMAADEGQPCSAGTCAPGRDLYCSVVCRARLGEGQACDLDDLLCDRALFCDADDVCAPRAGQGQACVLGGCAQGLRCDQDDATCRRWPPDLEGEPCAAEEADPCRASQLGLVCINAVCTLVTAAQEGEPCDAEGDADFSHAGWCLHTYSSHFCDVDAGICRQRPTAGESCEGAPCTLNESACRFDNAAQQLRCEALPDAGDPCLDNECTTWGCPMNQCAGDGYCGSSGLCLAPSLPPMCAG